MECPLHATLEETEAQRVTQLVRAHCPFPTERKSGRARTPGLRGGLRGTGGRTSAVKLAWGT